MEYIFIWCYSTYFNGTLIGTKFQINFKTTSDTEVLLYYLIFFGPELTCKKINGMWSFVFYDVKKKKIFFSRDRCGEKPLYYYIHNNNLIVASELNFLLSVNAYPYIIDVKIPFLLGITVDFMFEFS